MEELFELYNTNVKLAYKNHPLKMVEFPNELVNECILTNSKDIIEYFMESSNTNFLVYSLCSDLINIFKYLNGDISKNYIYFILEDCNHDLANNL